MSNSTHQNDEATIEANKNALMSSVGRTSKIKEIESSVTHIHQQYEQRPEVFGKPYNGVSGKD